MHLYLNNSLSTRRVARDWYGASVSCDIHEWLTQLLREEVIEATIQHTHHLVFGAWFDYKLQHPKYKGSLGRGPVSSGTPTLSNKCNYVMYVAAAVPRFHGANPQQSSADRRITLLLCFLRASSVRIFGFGRRRG